MSCINLCLQNFLQMRENITQRDTCAFKNLNYPVKVIEGSKWMSVCVGVSMYKREKNIDVYSNIGYSLKQTTKYPKFEN
jgi:hypothetical protein